MNKTELGEWTFMIVIYGVMLAAAIGWCLNIYKLATMGLDPIGLFVLRIVGLFLAPLGAVIGWVN